MPTLPEAKPYTIPATPNPIPVYLLNSFLAEGKGFEPPEPCGSSDFESDAIDHSESISAF